MRRLMVLVTVVLLIATMLMITAMPAMVAATRPPIAGIMGGGGVSVDPAACELLAGGGSGGCSPGALGSVLGQPTSLG
jgi:hypothetical protein